MIKTNAGQYLKDEPFNPIEIWEGYFHNTDATKQPFNSLAYGSQNCFVPSKDRVVPRAGKKLRGQAWTLEGGTVGAHDNFTNKTGFAINIKVFFDQDNDQFIFYFLYTDPDDGTETYLEFRREPVSSLGDIIAELEGGVRIYFDEWYDDETEKGRLIWVLGTGLVYSWTGSFAIITEITGTTIKIAETSWAGAGFDGDAITVNGVTYTVVSGNGTQTITVADTTGITVGDLAIDRIRTVNLSSLTGSPKLCMPMTIKNHVVYGDFESRKLYGSNAINVASTAIITEANAVLNDLSITHAQDYTQSDPASLRFVITDTVDPPERQYRPADPTDADNLVFVGTHTGNTRDEYVVVIATLAPVQTANIFRNGVGVGSFEVNDALGPDNLVSIGNGMSVYFTANTAHQIGTGWALDIGGVDKYQVYENNSETPEPGGPFDADDPYDYNDIIFKFDSPTRHTLGDNWTVLIEPAVTEAYADFYRSSPTRKPGQGFTINLSSNFWTGKIQENVLYINDQRGKWRYLELKLSADLLTEAVIVEPLKETGTSKVIFPYMIDAMDNYLVFVVQEKRLDFIGRKEFIELPQIGNLSEPVALDFLAASFAGGSIKEVDRKLWITSPDEGSMFCWDNAPTTKYWQPPQYFTENGILSRVGSKLVSHSTVRNQSFILFETDQGDAGSAYEVIIRTAYQSHGDRWNIKNSSLSFLEGYITGAPELNFTAYLGVNGCGGILPHKVQPVVCITPDRAPIGQGSLGSHSLGSDQFNNDSYFQEMYTGYSPTLEYYFIAMEVTCIAKNHSWSVLSMGMNAMMSPKGNNDISRTDNDQVL